MGREIKFRAWVNDKECVTFNGMREVNSINFGINQIRIDTEDGNILIHPDDYELMQYTGLKDKEGVDIYEGDILSVNDPDGEKMDNIEMEWDEKSAGYHFDYDFIDYDGTSIGCAIPLGFEFRVIGNIYENANLLIKEK